MSRAPTCLLFIPDPLSAPRLSVSLTTDALSVCPPQGLCTSASSLRFFLVLLPSDLGSKVTSEGLQCAPGHHSSARLDHPTARLGPTVCHHAGITSVMPPSAHPAQMEREVPWHLSVAVPSTQRCPVEGRTCGSSLLSILDQDTVPAAGVTSAPLDTCVFTPRSPSPWAQTRADSGHSLRGP